MEKKKDWQRCEAVCIDFKLCIQQIDWVRVSELFLRENIGSVNHKFSASYSVSHLLYASLLLFVPAMISWKPMQGMQHGSQKAGPSSSHPHLVSICVPTEHSLLLIHKVCLFSHAGLFPFSLGRRNSCHKSKSPVRQMSTCRGKEEPNDEISVSKYMLSFSKYKSFTIHIMQFIMHVSTNKTPCKLKLAC